jgi:glycosyltransferase involved in cell wall biosynthesis
VVVGYLPFRPSAHSTEAQWLAEALSCEVRLLDGGISLNLCRHAALPRLDTLRAAVARISRASAVVAEGIGGFLWAALLRESGFCGPITVIPYVNPTSWFDVSCIATYGRFRHPADAAFVGSKPSAAIFAALSVPVRVGEPYGIDCAIFHPRPNAARVLEVFGIPRGRILLFSGRAEPDKDLYRLLRTALKARLLFSDLQIVIATHVIDRAYMELVARHLQGERGVHLIRDPRPEELADLYNVADVFVTAATSHFETFGRAVAEALACGTRVIAPRYDGFAETAAQAGGTLVDIEFTDGVPHVNEELLLRAIYDALSKPSLPPREVIARAAQKRFCRARTLAVLTARPPIRTSRCRLLLPSGWQRALDDIRRASPQAALAHLWDHAEHGILSSADDSFRNTVRRVLSEEARSPALSPVEVS